MSIPIPVDPQNRYRFQPALEPIEILRQRILLTSNQAAEHGGKRLRRPESLNGKVCSMLTGKNNARERSTLKVGSLQLARDHSARHIKSTVIEMYSDNLVA